MNLASLIVPILYSGNASYSIDYLRQLIRDMTKDDPRPDVRKLASLDTQSFISEILRINESLSLLGMQIQFAAGALRLATLPVSFPPLLAYLDSLQDKHPLKLSPQAVEVLSVVAFKQPITLSDINSLFGGTDKREIASHLVHLGLLDRRFSPEGLRYFTTQAFLDRFKLNSLDDVLRLLDDPANRSGKQTV